MREFQLLVHDLPIHCAGGDFSNRTLPWERASGKPVARDGANCFLSSVGQHAKNSLIVLVPFYVKSCFNDALDMVGKEELRKTKKWFLVRPPKAGCPG
jgi:hypothetical protein